MQDKNNHYKNLKAKLEERHKGIKERLVTKHKDALSWVSNNTKQLTAGTVGSLLLLASPTLKLIDKQPEHVNQQFAKLPENVFLITDLSKYVPDQVGALISGQEEKIASILSDYYNLPVKPDINGLRLQHTYGYIGAEQHLMRYPGDSVENMAPGRGAYGYFASSRENLTQKEVDMEKYYIAVQTFLATDFATRTSEYRDFFKYRKMLVVNPNNGRAMVVVIGDAGPAVWTKKHLGGSPEVMKYLQRVDGSQKGGVLYFFIDDPEDKIPLGPIEPKVKVLNS